MGRFLRDVLLYVANLNQFRSAIELLTFILFANFIANEPSERRRSDGEAAAE